jgi:hypothetical protein
VAIGQSMALAAACLGVGVWGVPPAQVRSITRVNAEGRMHDYELKRGGGIGGMYELVLSCCGDGEGGCCRRGPFP